MVGCCKPGCLGEPVQNGRTSLAICPLCRLANCLNCNAIHEGISCKAYMKSIAADVSPAQTATNQGGQTLQPQTDAVRFQSISAATSGSSQKKTAPPLSQHAAEADEDSSEILVYCKVTGCEGVGFVDKDDAMFRCVVCNHFTCIKCSAFHESMTCAEYHKNKDNVQVPLYKPGLPEEGGEEPEPEEAEDDEDAEGRIVECAQENCKGFSYVYKTATMAQCEICQHWTCVACKACHESQTCAQYKGIDVPAEAELPEPLVPSSALPMLPRSQKKIQKQENNAGNSEGGFFSEAKNLVRNFLRGKTGDVGDEPAGAVGTVATARAYENFPKVQKGAHAQSQAVSEVAAIRGYENCKKVQENVCDACSCAKPVHVAVECEHALCRKCIQTAVENSTVYKIITCPARVEYHLQQCSGRLKEDEYKPHVTSRTLNNVNAKKNWLSAECFNKRCSFQGKPGSFFIKRATASYVCPLCRVQNCWTCRAIHDGMSCEAYVKKLVADIDAGKLEDPREKEKRYQELIAVYKQDVVSTTQEFECAICFVDVEPGKGIILRNCHHKVCEQCLADTAKNSPNAEVKCPCLEDDAPCEMSVFDSDLRACLSKEEYDALQDRSLREAENRSKEPSFHCKTPDCKGWCLHDQEVELFQCPVCNKENCLRCEAIHEGMTCAQYQDDLKRRAENDAAAKASLNFLEEMLRSQQAMRCPQCRIVIIKRVGCDFMVCTSCKTQLCWATKGARWGPNGVGDTSGGCRCGVGGVKCHPTCTTCH